MSPSEPRTFLSRIRAALPTLHPSERRLAEVVLNFPGELASYSASELARLANVSNATVTRFVRKVGYASFEEARQAAREGARGGAALFRVVARDDSGPEAALGAHLDQARLNLDQTFAAIHQAQVDDLARAILEAPRTWVLGFRTAQAFAQYLGTQLRQVVPDVSVLPGAGQTLAEALASVRPGDCVVVFALRRPVRGLPAVVAEIARAGARLALIEDGALPDTTPAAWRLRCHTAAPGPLFGHVAVLALAHFLATRVVELAGPAGRRRLATVEGLHESLDEL
jgi:DNA-binding MurR/RpiR family transcriptional regulator